MEEANKTKNQTREMRSYEGLRWLGVIASSHLEMDCLNVETAKTGVHQGKCLESMKTKLLVEIDTDRSDIVHEQPSPCLLASQYMKLGARSLLIALPIVIASMCNEIHIKFANCQKLANFQCTKQVDSDHCDEHLENLDHECQPQITFQGI